MNKALLVLRNEIITTVTRRSFLLVAVGIPLMLVLVGLIVWFISRPGTVATTSSPDRTQLTSSEGFVDRSGIIVSLPPDVSPSALVRFADEQAANDALSLGAIQAYYVVPADYLASGKLYYVHPQASLTTSARTAWVMQWTLLVNMLHGDVARATRVWNPMRITATDITPQQAANRDEGGGLFMLPYFVVFAFYLVVIMSGSLLRNSLGEERKNRVQEILLTTVSPLQFLAGKIAALGIVGLLQMLLWASVGYGVLRLLGPTNALPAGFHLPPSMIAWAGIFFLLGYAVYGSLLAGLGALTGPNSPGSSTADVVVLWPSIIPLVLWAPIVDYPNGTLAVVLSLFPLTSPVAMLMRLVVGGVPAWQLAVAIVLLIMTAYLIIRGVAVVLRAQNLLTGQPFTLKRYLGMMLGRA